MHRITGTYVDPTANGVGKPGFTQGTPGATGATVVTDDWLNAVQEEIAGVIEATGAALSSGSNAQLLAAVQSLVGFTTISPTELTGTNHSNYAPTGWSTAGIVRITAADDAAIILGLDATAAVSIKLIVNVDATNIVTLKHNDGTQTAGNKLLSPTGADIAIQPGSGLYVVKDATSLGWRILADRYKTAFRGLATFTDGLQSSVGIQVDSGGVTCLGGGSVSALQGDFSELLIGASGATCTSGAFNIDTPNSAADDFNFTGTKPVLTTWVSPSGGQGSAAWVVDTADLYAIHDAAPQNDGTWGGTHRWYKEVHLPHGAVLNDLLGEFAQATDTTRDSGVALVSVAQDGTETELATVKCQTFGGTRDYNSWGLGTFHTVDCDNLYFLVFFACDNSGGTCSAYRAGIQYQDPGPRNPGTR